VRSTETAPAHEPPGHVQRTISVAGGPALMNVWPELWHAPAEEKVTGAPLGDVPLEKKRRTVRVTAPVEQPAAACA